jgi:hypothetical protein
MSEMEDLPKDIRRFLRDFAIALIQRDFEPNDTLGDINDFISEFMEERYEKEPPK